MRAVLADPGDGEITAEYAKLVWEVHRDSHKASVYFERAVQASPENRYKFLLTMTYIHLRKIFFVLVLKGLHHCYMHNTWTATMIYDRVFCLCDDMI